MGREKEPRSRVRRRKRGCLTGCLVNVLLVLGVAALLFVGACVLGFVKNDPQTGKPSLSLQNIGLGEVQLPDFMGAVRSTSESIEKGLATLPAWAYGMSSEGMTVKTLRAGGGEAVLVCCDGYTMLVGAGSNGLLTSAQLLLCGVTRLSVAVAGCAENLSIGGMATAVGFFKPEYLLMQDSQTKSVAYNEMYARAKQSGAQVIAPDRGLTFSLGRATVTVIGPARENHTDERDDGLSLRIDYGSTSVLIPGTITSAGEQELVSSGVRMEADVLICSRGGSDEATSLRLVETARPRAALLTGNDPANSVLIRLQRAGTQAYTAREHGVMTVVSDGSTITVKP